MLVIFPSLTTNPGVTTMNRPLIIGTPSREALRAGREAYDIVIDHLFVRGRPDIDTQVADELDAAWVEVRGNLTDAVLSYG